jgi:hypothetical protein
MNGEMRESHSIGKSDAKDRNTTCQTLSAEEDETLSVRHLGSGWTASKIQHRRINQQAGSEISAHGQGYTKTSELQGEQPECPMFQADATNILRISHRILPDVTR